MGHLGVLTALLVLAGCGGSGYASSSASAPAATVSVPSGASSTRASATASSAASSGTSTQTGSSTAQSTSAAAPPSGGAGITSTPPAGGADNARVPATFAIAGGGTLSPTTVSAPAFVAILVTIASRDGHEHHVLIRTPAPRPLTVPAGGRAVVFVSGQKAGRYVIDVDGAPRGALMIGGEPGP